MVATNLRRKSAHAHTLGRDFELKIPHMCEISQQINFVATNQQTSASTALLRVFPMHVLYHKVHALSKYVMAIHSPLEGVSYACAIPPKIHALSKYVMAVQSPINTVETKVCDIHNETKIVWQY